MAIFTTKSTPVYLRKPVIVLMAQRFLRAKAARAGRRLLLNNQQPCPQMGQGLLFMHDTAIRCIEDWYELDRLSKVCPVTACEVASAILQAEARRRQISELPVTAARSTSTSTSTAQTRH